MVARKCLWGEIMEFINIEMCPLCKNMDWYIMKGSPCIGCKHKKICDFWKKELGKRTPPKTKEE